MQIARLDSNFVEQGQRGFRSISHQPAEGPRSLRVHAARVQSYLSLRTSGGGISAGACLRGSRLPLSSAVSRERAVASRGKASVNEARRLAKFQLALLGLRHQAARLLSRRNSLDFFPLTSDGTHTRGEHFVGVLFATLFYGKYIFKCRRAKLNIFRASGSFIATAFWQNYIKVVKWLEFVDDLVKTHKRLQFWLTRQQFFPKIQVTLNLW